MAAKKKAAAPAPATEPETVQPAHSSIVGGSNAARRLACPASYQLEQRVPESVRNRSSNDADEGTALHAAIAKIIENNLDPYDVEGEEFGDVNPFVMTRDLIESALVPAIEWLDDLLDGLENEGEVVETIAVELRASMPGIQNAFGTCDLTVKTSRRTIITDWKFGIGVPVKVIYADPVNGDLLNAQPLFYGRAMLHDRPDLFGGDTTPEGLKTNEWPVDLYINQPRIREGVGGEKVSHAQVTVAELEEFRWALINAVAKATSADPGEPIRGDHCRFASCKVICPRFTGAALDLSKMLDASKKRAATPLGDVFDYGEALGAILDLSNVVMPMFAAAEKQAHAYMESGAYVPGYKIVATRAQRKWKDEAEATEALRKAGYADQMYDLSLKSPAQMEKITKADTVLTEKIKDEKASGTLITKQSSGTKVAPEDAASEGLIPYGVVVEQFAQKLASILPKE